VAEALRKEPDVQVEVRDGNRGEFTVLLDNKEIAEMGDSLPPVEEVVAAVKKEVPVEVGS
jgi:hypothetical protein